jgi:hypothetical protein
VEGSTKLGHYRLKFTDYSLLILLVIRCNYRVLTSAVPEVLFFYFNEATVLITFTATFSELDVWINHFQNYISAQNTEGVFSYCSNRARRFSTIITCNILSIEQ